jgi:hypothetical protein
MGLKSAVKRWVLGRPGPRPRAVRVGLLRGRRFVVDVGNKSMRLLGLDETEIASAMRRLSRGVATGVDVGANDAWYSLYLASVPSVRQVLAFEPEPSHHARFEENFALNDPALRAKVRLVPKFVGRTRDERTVPLDDELRDAAGPILIKIDVDGGEMDVLRGAGATLARPDVRLVIETHSAELERECVALLERAGYRTTIIPNGWYRAIVPEQRMIAHNRWLTAARPA